MKQEWQKSPARARQTDGKTMALFGEKKSKRLLLFTVLSLTYFMSFGIHKGFEFE
jgi:hypothetical protein